MRLVVILAGIVLFLVACAGKTAVSYPQPIPATPTIATNPRIDDPTEYPFRQWARNDAIPPIYKPEFAPATAVNLQNDELIMGISLQGQAKAYPVTVLQFREMVNDELAGIPILVTW